MHRLQSKMFKLMVLEDYGSFFTTKTPCEWYYMQLENLKSIFCLNHLPESYFEDTKLEVEVAYFVHNCASLTESQKQQIAVEFKDLLESKGICLSNGQASCQLSDFTVVCGEEVEDFQSFDFFRRRKRRSSPEGFVIKFSVAPVEIPVKVCGTQCGTEPETSDDGCWDLCEDQLRARDNATLQSAQNKVENLFKATSSPPSTASGNPSPGNPSMSISVNGIALSPMQGVHTVTLSGNCGSGMAHNADTRRCGE